MTQTSVLSVAAILLGGAALAVAWMRGPEAAPATGPGLPSVGGLDADTAEHLRARLAAVEAAQRELADRLAMLEAGVTVASRTPAASRLASQDELEELREELLGALGGESPRKAGTGDDVPSPEFTEHVELSLKEIRLRQAREDAARTVAARAERLRSKLPAVAQQLGLTVSQESSLESSLVTLYERRADYGVLWESGEVVEKSAFRELDEANMSAFLADLGGFLTAQQLEDYLALTGDLFPGGDHDGGK